MLVNVVDAYQTVLGEAAQADPILGLRRAEIANQIAQINSRAQAVEKVKNDIIGPRFRMVWTDGELRQYFSYFHDLVKK